MGTSTMGGDLHSDKQDKLLKLQARKRELELMLAAKNEELYKLCVREVQLTGVVPPEAPLSPDAPRERRASLRCTERAPDGADVQDGAERARRPRALRRPDASGANFFPSPPQERLDTFSLHSAYPAPEQPRRPPARPEPHPLHQRHRDAHFSSSHPDIANYPPAHAARPAPLLYQYAAQLRAQSQHLRQQPARRGALQRTQTYHLTAHSDYAPHPPPPEPPRERRVPVPATLPLRAPLHIATDDCSPQARRAGYSPADSDSLSVNKFSPLSPLSPLDGRPKEKQWYETSLDAPARGDSALRKSASLKRTPGAAASQPYEIMVSTGRQSALRSPAALSPGAVALESPNNMTVIEQGKCIPYREETKPFEMSDFYKYSTKFRQASAPAPRPAHPSHPAAPYDRLPADLPPFSPDHWRGYAN